MSMIGKTLGSFECTALIGKGGMGEVYKAKDQKLGRDVAIKVLPVEFAKDADRVARFQREAKLLASLNHPNIASIYGLEESSGTHFLVLELIEGDTLADRLKRGAIPVEEALKLALQIAEALEAAHEKGVIHRDLKPANIKVTPDGKVKVLDFGLAKAFAGEQGDLNLSNSPTLSAAATQQGVILGTAAYMSPEQARGETVDKKADIWAFGVVLFEMLTGRAIFDSRTVSDTLAAVLMREPEWSGLPPNLHSRIRFLLERCLKKESQNRYSGISDARVDIQEVLADPSGLLVQPIIGEKPRSRLHSMLPWFAAIILAVITIGVTIWNLRSTEPRRVMRFDYDLPENQEFAVLMRKSVAVSPDGMKIVYRAGRQLHLKDLQEFTAGPIRGTDEDPVGPFFSPDGQWIGYWSEANSQLKKIAVIGGAPVRICETTDYTGGTWGADDMIVFGRPGGIMQVSANGGNPEPIIDSGFEIPLEPQVLPDGKSILFSLNDSGELKVVIQSVGEEEPKILTPGFSASYLPTGHLVYASENNLFAVPFDLDTRKITSGPVSMLEGILALKGPAAAPMQYAISNTGNMVYIPGSALMGGSNLEFTLVWVDRQGKEELIAANPNNYSEPKISPDGTKVAVTIGASGRYDIWIWDFARENMTRLTFNESSNHALWTPDGQRIAFVWESSEGENVLRWKASDGTGEDEPLNPELNRYLWPRSWSKDGKLLLADDLTGLGVDIGCLSMEGSREWKLLLHQEYNEIQPEISPDGRWMAYASNESSQFEIYVRPFPNINEGRWQISTDGGDTPLWSPNGSELFYRSGDSVMAVDVETESTFKHEKPKSLFQGRFVRSSAVNSHIWDISPDGDRFLMMKPSGITEDESTSPFPRKINIVLNWFEELKERVPTP